MCHKKLDILCVRERVRENEMWGGDGGVRVIIQGYSRRLHAVHTQPRTRYDVK
jgi:hypothetical protein